MQYAKKQMDCETAGSMVYSEKAERKDVIICPGQQESATRILRQYG